MTKTTKTEATKMLSVFAPAKINLYLHITGRLDNGYHTLDSLIAFVDIGDEINLRPSPDFKFETAGDFAGSFSAKELDSSPSSSNLLVKAAWALSRAVGKTPDVHAALTKNLPLGAGIGGGSSDAAALIWGLLEWWGLPKTLDSLPTLLTNLGADVPVCLPCRASRVRGIGDILDPAPLLPEIPIVIVYPGKPCSTVDVFRHHKAEFKQPVSLTSYWPSGFDTLNALLAFLEDTQNDLMDAAIEIVPEITNVLSTLDAQKGCAFNRMTGSGSSCFGLFEHEHDAQIAAAKIAEENPDWWVKSGWLNRPERY